MDLIVVHWLSFVFKGLSLVPIGFHMLLMKAVDICPLARCKSIREGLMKRIETNHSCMSQVATSSLAEEDKAIEKHRYELNQLERSILVNESEEYIHQVRCSSRPRLLSGVRGAGEARQPRQ
jgi:hypothetical protein